MLVVNTETRHLEPAAAAARVARAVAANPARLIYKKTDSTLRGNIGAELGALLEACPDSPLLYVPAYPELGRVVKQGHLYVHGELAHETVFANDALNPVAYSDIARVLRLQTGAPIFSVAAAGLENLEPGSIYICDAESGRGDRRGGAHPHQLRLPPGRRPRRVRRRHRGAHPLAQNSKLSRRQRQPPRAFPPPGVSC